MLKLVCDLKDVGVKATVKPIGNESLITRARNCLFSDFMDSEENYTHLLFIDADIGFTSMDVMKLLKCDKPLVGATYPHKNIFWNSFSKIIEKHGTGILTNPKKLESISNTSTSNPFCNNSYNKFPKRPKPIMLTLFIPIQPFYCKK